MIKSILIIVPSLVFIKILIDFKGATKEQPEQTESTNELRTLDLKLIFGFILMIPTNVVILTYLLTQISNIGFTSEPLSEFVIRPNMGTWIAISMMLSLATSVVMLILLVKLIKKDTAYTYWKHYNMKYGFNASGLLKHLSIVIILFTAAIIMVQMNSYVKFNKDSIVINRLLDFEERTYKLTDISEVTYYQKAIAPNGNIVNKPHYGIRFKDGFSWRTNDDLRTSNINDDKIFMWLIKQIKSDFTITEIDKK